MYRKNTEGFFLNCGQNCSNLIFVGEKGIFLKAQSQSKAVMYAAECWYTDCFDGTPPRLAGVLIFIYFDFLDSEGADRTPFKMSILGLKSGIKQEPK